jgi:hypothetical protein
VRGRYASRMHEAGGRAKALARGALAGRLTRLLDLRHSV